MKTCAVCKHTSDGRTCPRCGEASWLPAKTSLRAKAPRKAEPAPAVDEDPPKSEPPRMVPRFSIEGDE